MHTHGARNKKSNLRIQRDRGDSREKRDERGREGAVKIGDEKGDMRKRRREDACIERMDEKGERYSEKRAASAKEKEIDRAIGPVRRKRGPPRFFHSTPSCNTANRSLADGTIFIFNEFNINIDIQLLR